MLDSSQVYYRLTTFPCKYCGESKVVEDSSQEAAIEAVQLWIDSHHRDVHNDQSEFCIRVVDRSGEFQTTCGDSGVMETP